jgi:hypothetical protein
VPIALSNAAKYFGENFDKSKIFGKVFSADEGRALNASELAGLDTTDLSSIYAEMGEAGK